MCSHGSGLGCSREGRSIRWRFWLQESPLGFSAEQSGHRCVEGRQRDEVECAIGTWGEGEERRKVQASLGSWVVERSGERLNPDHGQLVRDSPQGMVLGRNANSLSSGLTSQVCVSLLFLVLNYLLPWLYRRQDTHVEVIEQPTESALSFHCVGPEGRTQVTSLGGKKNLYPVNPPNSVVISFLIQ